MKKICIVLTLFFILSACEICPGRGFPELCMKFINHKNEIILPDRILLLGKNDFMIEDDKKKLMSERNLRKIEWYSKEDYWCIFIGSRGDYTVKIDWNGQSREHHFSIIGSCPSTQYPIISFTQ